MYRDRPSHPDHPAVARALRAAPPLTRRAFVARALELGVSLAALSPLLAACRPERPRGAAGGAGAGELEGELNIFNWSDYIAEETIPGFEREFGVRVTYDTYESNEEMVAKLQAGGSGYDLVVPSGYVVPVLVATGLAAPLEKERLPNWKHLAPLFLDPPFDRGNAYTAPWQWGTSGIAYRSDRIPEPPESWAVFHDPRYRGRMTMLDDGREVIGAMLKLRGHSLNSTDPAPLERARADAIAAKANLKAFVSAPVKGQLVTGDVWLAQLWNGDAAQARTEQPALAYAIPREGGAIWLDSLLIPASAPHQRAAHAFIDYVLRPEVAARIAEFTGYGTPNEAALALMRDPVPYPTPAELERLEYQADLGEHTELWDRIWTEIKAA